MQQIERMGLFAVGGVWLYGYISLFREHFVLGLVASIVMAAGLASLLQND